MLTVVPSQRCAMHSVAVIRRWMVGGFTVDLRCRAVWVRLITEANVEISVSFFPASLHHTMPPFGSVLSTEAIRKVRDYFYYIFSCVSHLFAILNMISLTCDISSARLFCLAATVDVIKEHCSSDKRRMLILSVETWANASQVCSRPSTSSLVTSQVRQSSDTQPCSRDCGARVFWSGFFLMLHWGALGPIVKSFFSTFSILLE